MKLKRFNFLLFLLGSTFSFLASAQNSEIFNWFDAINGDQNAELYNGVVFIDEFKVTNNKHRFFETNEFILGDVSFNGNSYYSQKLKYDLLYDQLLVNPKTASDALVIQMVKAKIDSFKLKEHKFIKISTKIGIETASEYYEKLSDNKVIMPLKKHVASNLGKRHEKLYYEFRLRTKLFIYFDNNIYPANSKSKLIAVFPKHKKLIKKIYRQNKILKKSNPDNFLRYLVNQLDPFFKN